MGLPDLPFVFLDYQKELMRTVSLYAVTIVEKSRRVGYSWAMAAIAVMTAAAAKNAGGDDVLYMGYDHEMARGFINDAADFARALTPALVDVQEFIWTDPDNPDRDIKAFRIDFASGHSIVALPSVARALRSRSGLVIIDEAAFLDDLEAVLQAALALLIWGGKVVILSTHYGEANPFNALINDVRAGRKPYALLRCTFDDALADGLYKRICAVKGRAWSPEAEAAWREETIAFYGDGADEELFCVPSAGSGIAIPTALIEARMNDAPVLVYACDDTFVHKSDELRISATDDWLDANIGPLLDQLPKDCRHVYGMDFARSADLSDIWPLTITSDLRKITPFLLEMRNVPFRQQEQILFYICDRLPNLDGGAMDARGNGQALAEYAMQRYGSIIVQVMLSEGWYRDNMPLFVADIEDGIMTLPRNDGVRSDFRALRKIKGIVRVPETKNKDASGNKRHGDSAIAAALANAASRAEIDAYGYEPANGDDNKSRGDSTGGLRQSGDLRGRL